MKYLYKDLKGANRAMIREYVTPDFDVTIYEIEDVITVSGGNGGYEGVGGNGDAGWWG